MPTEARLCKPCLQLAPFYLEMAREFRAAGEEFHAEELAEAEADLAGFVRKLQRAARGEGLAEGFVPYDTFWLVVGGEVVATSRLRHWLTPRLVQEGGHIGYDVRPSRRGRGYATRILAATLEKARERGLKHALVTCTKDNVASARVIEKNGGVLEDERFSERHGKLMRRYWIPLRDSPPRPTTG